VRDGKPYLAWGTPGGDQQEQWALHVFLRHVDLGENLQEAIDAPDFHTDHLISSFYPRGFARPSVTVESRFGGERPPPPPHPHPLSVLFYPRASPRRSVTVESRFGDEVVEDLRRRGHDVD